MANVSKARTRFKSGTLTVTEGDLVTEAYKVQGLDLVIEQTKEDDTRAYISHYSNPGTCFFVGLMKFLYVNREQIPEVKEPEGPCHDEFKDSAKWFAGLFAAHEFPINYTYSPAMGREEPLNATLSVFYREDSPPELQIDLWREKMLISVDAAKALIRGIPKIYPEADSFHVAYVEFLRKAAKYPEQVAEEPRQEEKGVQLEFESLRRLRRKQGNRRS